MKTLLAKFRRARSLITIDHNLSNKNIITKYIPESDDILFPEYTGLALYKCRMMLDYARLEKQIRLQITLHYKMAKLYNRSSQLMLACKHFALCLRLLNKLDKSQAIEKEIASVLYDLGSTLYETSEMLYQQNHLESKVYLIQSAITYYKQVIELTSSEEFDLNGRTLGMLGNCFHRLSDYLSAIFYHHKRLDLARRTYNIDAEARANYNIGNAYISMEKPEFAEEFFGHASDLCPSAVNLFTVAVVLMLNGKYPQAILRLKAALRCNDCTLHDLIKKKLVDAYKALKPLPDANINSIEQWKNLGGEMPPDVFINELENYYGIESMGKSPKFEINNSNINDSTEEIDLCSVLNQMRAMSMDDQRSLLPEIFKKT